MRKLLIIILFIAGISISSSAQETLPCYTHEAFETNSLKYPGYREAVNKVVQYASTYGTKSLSKNSGGDTVFRIPVVFHVVYRTSSENLHDSLIISQLKVLNENFNRIHADTGNTRIIFKSVAGSAKIEFYLADRDRNGNPSIGIVRVQTTRPSFITSMSGDYLAQADRLKQSAQGGSDAWDPDRYLNIWSGNITYNGNALLLGYAYPPANLSNWPSNNSAPSKGLEGVVLHYGIVGIGNPANNHATNKKGRTAVHEVGHFLGLRHIWGDASNCGIGDYIEDTPPMSSNSQTGNCNAAKNTCTGDAFPDMIENYMDYSPEVCQNMFTVQQVNLMRNVLRLSRPMLANLVITNPDAEPETEISAPTGFTIQPNPAGSQISIIFQGIQTNAFIIDVQDVTGRRVATQAYEQGSLQYGLDLDELSPGIYYMVIRANGKSKAVKFMIARD